MVQAWIQNTLKYEETGGPLEDVIAQSLNVDIDATTQLPTAWKFKDADRAFRYFVNGTNGRLRERAVRDLQDKDPGPHLEELQPGFAAASRFPVRTVDREYIRDTFESFFTDVIDYQRWWDAYLPLYPDSRSKKNLEVTVARLFDFGATWPNPVLNTVVTKMGKVGTGPLAETIWNCFWRAQLKYPSYLKELGNRLNFIPYANYQFGMTVLQKMAKRPEFPPASEDLQRLLRIFKPYQKYS